ncbi:response regulator transcription factor [Novosphingobium resinovorum]|jgi:two-component system OmpR family response regulator|uniref:DNA-binding response regulator n=1 Tax=Novosphingobium resinovorum TaxID=158500 RepID=A0A031J8N9_9SPHN|nr:MULTISPECIES: response regulator transcription factor [Novosphingobium]AOR79182.1 DNA-binding response regulator [Novosphingobium resinovorum]EZP69586.1 Two-component system OmpR family response regulator [Novosphingobium resinovorum]MBF7014809.1 response regulator transcription factor [Novosphingobium sp. HR1a]WJM24706.1 response regulator transcription factor [Novosphingobium resinovorum]
MRILLAEDDPQAAEFVARGLRDLGHSVTVAADGRDALQITQLHDHDVLVLDRMMPVHDGIQVLRALRSAQVHVPVLLLTALGRIEDRVEGLEAGADDYLVKPFAFAELAARVQALGRRSSNAGGSTTQLMWGVLRMDLLRREVTCGGERIALQPREFALLEELIRGGGKTITRTMLLETVWEFHFDPRTNIVETHMSRLRGKLAEGGAKDIIETVRGVGYRMRAV